ncbi:hypothetical protein Dimus_018570 [Dionaea muscipula]
MGCVPSSSFLNSYRRLQRLAGDALLGDGKRWQREAVMVGGRSAMGGGEPGGDRFLAGQCSSVGQRWKQKV